jgi:hypothetical protein
MTRTIVGSVHRVAICEARRSFSMFSKLPNNPNTVRRRVLRQKESIFKCRQQFKSLQIYQVIKELIEKQFE